MNEITIIEKIKNLIKQDNLYELKSFIIYNDLKRSQISSDVFDTLNYAIENNASSALVNFIITLYNGLNYEINDAGIPLYIAIQFHRFDIADQLIQHGANINFSSWNGDNILIHFLKFNKLDKINLKYILKQGVDINFEDENQSHFLDFIIDTQHISFLKTVFEHFVYNNTFILNMILLHKNKIQLSNEELKSLIYEEKKRIKITSSMYIKTIKDDNLALLKLLIENDRTKHIMDIKNKYRLLLVASEINHWDIAIYLIENLEMKINEKNRLHKTPLMFASEQGNKKIVEYLIEQGALVNDKDKNGQSPIIYACKNGKIDVVEYLLKSGAIIDDRDRNDMTPLMHAAVHGHNDIISFLLEHNADIHARSRSGSSVLIYAAMHNQKETMELLLSYGLDINGKNSGGWTVLMHACKAGKLEVVKYLVEHGASINERNGFRKTALIYASQSGHVGVVRYLLENGAIDFRSQDGSIALMLAAQNGHRKVVEYIIKSRIEKEKEKLQDINKERDIHLQSQMDNLSKKSEEELRKEEKTKTKNKNKGKKNKYGFPSLHYYKKTIIKNCLDEDIIMVLRMATQNKQIDIVDYIIEECSSLPEQRKQKDMLSRTAYFRAVEVNCKEIVDYFIGRGVSINVQDDLGNTGLMIASSYGYDNLVYYFLFHQADKNVYNSDHNTALHLACYGGFTAIVESLVSHGAIINAEGYGGNTPLIVASKDNNEAVVKCLVAYGADVNTRNHHGKTALFYASKYGRLHLVKYLIDHGANMRLKNNYGCNPLLAALLKGHRPTLNYLLGQVIKESRNSHYNLRRER
eukprot:jgi/Orpsp1_1/1179056/evm.model.c7180000067754.1